MPPTDDLFGRSQLQGLLVVSRPRFWFYLAGPVVVGVTFAARRPAELFSPLAVGLFSYFMIPANVLLYGVNDVFDAEIDAENPKKDADGREVRFTGDRAVVVAVLGSGLLGVALLPVLPAAARPWFAGFLLLGVEYSAPPLRFKTSPLLDSVSNGLYVLPGAAAYAAVAGSHPPAAAVVGGWLWTMAMHTFSAIPDIEPDRRAGIRTTATVLGEPAAQVYCGVCWLAAAAAFGLLSVRLGLLLLAYPAVVAAVYLSRVDVARAYWWYPAINVAVGTLMTLGGLWRLVHG